MKSPLVITLITASLLVSVTSLAQDSASTDTPEPSVVLIKLSPPLYPPLAHQARIAGDVKVCVHVHKDGSVESVELSSGHPMLAPAALESARKSEFECRRCGDEVGSYLMTYTFGFLDDGKDREVVTERPSRTAKCLFLWKCGIERTTTWQCPEIRPSQITESHGHVTILVSTVCVEADTTYRSELRLPDIK